MLKQPAKYNPAFLSEERLVESFVARHADFSLILGILKENIGQPSNQHILLLGQRGIGKTTLALRVAAEVQRDDELKRAWLPLIFAEESYQVATPGEFWLEAIFHLGEKTRDERWKRTYKELKGEVDENRLRERALSQLMDFTDSIGKRLLLIVENFDMLLADQLGKDDAWALRHTFLNEPRIMMLATAIRRIDEFVGIDKAMFELFKVYELKPLGNYECRAVWTSITGKEISEQRIKPIQILTGGNPRLLTIISTFGANMSFKELMADIMQLVDDHTEYFKSHLDNLAPVERKVYLALAELWDPSTAREVAVASRLDVNKASSLLNRLVERGAVVVADGRKRTKWYQLSERMYNIYYLMRRRGAPSSRVQAVVGFMVSFYDEVELLNIAKCIATEACRLPSEQKEYSYSAYKYIVERMVDKGIADKFIRETPQEFFKPSNMPKSFEKEFIPQISTPPLNGRKWISIKIKARHELGALLYEAEELSKEPDKMNENLILYKNATEMAPDISVVWAEYGAALHGAGKHDEAEQAYRKAIEIEPKFDWAWMQLGELLHEKLERYDEAEQAYRQAIEIDPEFAWAWTQLGQLLHEKLERYDEAEQAYRKAIEIEPKFDWTWMQLGQLLYEKLERYDEAEQAYRKAIEIDPKFDLAWTQLGQLLHEKLERYDEAEQAYRKAIEIDPKFAWAWMQLGELLHEKLERYDEAERVYRKVIEIDPMSDWAWTQLGQLLHERLERYDEAEQAYRKAIEIDPEFDWAWMQLGQLLHEKLDRCDEAEQAYRKAIEIDPEFDWAWMQLGQLLHERLERYDEAEQAYRKAIEIDPEFDWAWMQLGQLLHERLERYDEAEQAYRKAIEIDPEFDWAWMQLGQLLHERLERYDEAEQAYRKAIEIDPKFDWAWAQLGQLLHEKLERYDEAEQAYRKAIEIAPSFDWAWAQLGQLFHEKLERYDEAEQAYQKAIEIDPKFAWAWAQLGQLFHEKLERYDEAEHAYRKAIEIDPKFAWAWAHLGQLLHEKLERYDEAEQAINTALKIQPEVAAGWIWLGLFLYEKMNKPNEAENAFKKALCFRPLEIAAIDCIVDLYLHNKKPEKIIELFMEYHEEISKSASALHTLAFAYYLSGNKEHLADAEEWVRKAVRMSPDDAFFQHTLASILTAQGKCDLALEPAKKYLQDIEVVGNCLEEATDLMIGLAARGYAEKTLEILTESPAAELLEPLIVGVRLYLGKDIRVATEILEVGKDVAKRIKERADLLS